MFLYDKVRVKSQNVIGIIVDVVGDDCTIAKAENAGTVYWNIPADDLELVEEI